MFLLNIIYYFAHQCIGAGTGGAGEQQLLPNKIIGGATCTSCSPIFFCNLQLKVTLETVRLLLTQKFSKVRQLASGVCPRPHCTLCIPFSKNTYRIKLYFEFDCLDCFSPVFASHLTSRSIFAPPTEKSFPRLCISE